MPKTVELSELEGRRYLFTLVHGTWARRTSVKKGGWIRPDSKLAKALRARFGSETKVFPFVWSGRNSVRARRDAAARLKRKLELRLRQYPGARHYIVCHSHGGNIALLALAGSDLEKRIDGVVCLATPFFLARERDLGPDRDRYMGGPCSYPFGWSFGSATRWVDHGGAASPSLS